MAPPTAASLLICRRPLAAPRLRLLCLPYAGGSASLFFTWTSLLPADIEVRSAQFPGRQERLSEPPLRSVEAMVDALAAALAPLPPAPLFIYGHSLGSAVGFELARRLQGTPHSARGLVAAARRAPQLPPNRPQLYQLPDPAFKDMLHRLYGMPLEVLRNDDLMSIALPSLRGDFTAHDLYTYTPGPPLELPLTILSGSKDPAVTRAEAEAWSEITTQYRGLHEVDGGHLFVQSHRQWVLARILDALQEAR